MSDPEEVDDLRVAPPHNDEAEQALLSAILKQGASEYHGDSVPGGSTYELLDLARRWIPGPSVFYDGTHARIWAGLLKLQEERKPIDVVLLRSQFRGEVKNGTPTTAERINALLDHACSPARAEQYAQIVYELSEKRNLLNLFAEARADLKSDNDSVVESVNRVQRGLAALGGISGAMTSVSALVLGLEAPENRDWAAEGLFPSKMLTVLVSDAKVGKTTLMFHIVKAMTTGSSCIGLACREATKILWVCEETRESIGRTCRKVGLVGENADKVEFITREWLGRLPWQRAVRAIIDRAKAIKADLIIIDTLGAWAGLRGEEENQAGPIQSALAPLQQATTEGFTIVLTHHANKDQTATGVNKIRGSSALAGAVDGFLLLKKEGGEDSPLRAISGYGRGEGWVNQLRYELDPDGGLRRVLRGSVQPVQDLDPSLTAKIVQCVTENPGISGSGVRRIVRGRFEDVIAALNSLVGSCVLKRDGGEGQGSATKYYVFGAQVVDEKGLVD